MSAGHPFSTTASGMIQLRILQFDQPGRMSRQLRALSVAQAQAIFLVFPCANNVNVIHKCILLFLYWLRRWLKLTDRQVSHGWSRPRNRLLRHPSDQHELLAMPDALA
jgi:hypothetical protein